MRFQQRVAAVAAVSGLLCTFLPTFAANAAIWTASAAVKGSSVEVAVTVRLSGCAGVGRVERQVDGEEPFVVWLGDDAHAVDTAEPFDSCKCEPLGTAWGTGMKSCPEEQCGKDDQCVCTELCVPVVDSCPPPGMLEYKVFDREGAEAVSTQLFVPDLLPGCKAPENPGPVVAEPAPGDGGGCQTASRPSSPLTVVLGALLLGVLRWGRRRGRRGIGRIGRIGRMDGIGGAAECGGGFDWRPRGLLGCSC